MIRSEGRGLLIKALHGSSLAGNIFKGLEVLIGELTFFIDGDLFA